MTTTHRHDRQLPLAAAAARAAVPLLPASSPLTAAEPTRDVTAVDLDGQAIRSRFTGAARGEVVIVVAQDLVDALADTPLGAMDVTQAVRPALEAAAGTLGPVVVDPSNVTNRTEALAALVTAGGAIVPLTDGSAVRGVVGLLVTVESAPAAPPVGVPPADLGRTGLDLLRDVEMEVTAELGRTRMNVRDLLSLSPGTVVELDRAAGGPADLLVNGRLIARGEVVVIDENFGIRLTEIVAPGEQRA
jgi:flagellar motor switch protein FliN/FliY